jgi:hypothetical protein
MSNPIGSPSGRQACCTRHRCLPRQSNRKDAYDKEQKDVELMRGDAIELVTDIWDEVLFTFRKESASSQRRLASEYGIKYRPSPGETPTADDFSLMGRATEDMTNLALADVEAYIPQLDLYATTDIDGNYYFGILPAGSYSVRFRKDWLLGGTETGCCHLPMACSPPWMCR